MKLGFDKIKEITLGTARVESNLTGVSFFRFTEAQAAVYERTTADFYRKTYSSAGVRLSFKTDSEKMFLKIFAARASGRRYFSLDVFVNGEMIGCIDNFNGRKLADNYTVPTYPLGEFSSNFLLGSGVKEVVIYLPWSVETELRELTLDEGSFVEAVRPQKKIIVYGDSITHGYDALRPSDRYPSRLANALGVEEINKGIGGAVFLPELAEERDDVEPEFVLVAYGTNDWSKFTKEEFIEKCRGFYAALSKNYPDSKIFALTPIWRADLDETRLFGSFYDIEPSIRTATEALPNVKVISCFDFVPKDEKMYADFRLHPNEEGFKYYFENLLSAIKTYDQ